MKQKYQIIKDKSKNSLIIKEFAELDKDILSLLCEENYALDAIEAACAAGRERLIAALRTNNMYPSTYYANQIATAVANLCQDDGTDMTEFFCNDMDFLSHERDQAALAEAAEADDETPDIDDMLEDDIDEKIDDASDMPGVNKTLKVADDESLDVDGDA